MADDDFCPAVFAYVLVPFAQATACIFKTNKRKINASNNTAKAILGSILPKLPLPFETPNLEVLVDQLANTVRTLFAIVFAAG